MECTHSLIVRKSALARHSTAAMMFVTVLPFFSISRDNLLLECDVRFHQQPRRIRRRSTISVQDLVNFDLGHFFLLYAGSFDLPTVQGSHTHARTHSLASLTILFDSDALHVGHVCDPSEQAQPSPLVIDCENDGSNVDAGNDAFRLGAHGLIISLLHHLRSLFNTPSKESSGHRARPHHHDGINVCLASAMMRRYLAPVDASVETFIVAVTLFHALPFTHTGILPHPASRSRPTYAPPKVFGRCMKYRCCRGMV